MMDTFVWIECFETGIELIDRQRRLLAETTNQLAEEPGHGTCCRLWLPRSKADFPA